MLRHRARGRERGVGGRRQQALANISLVIASLIGVAAFFYPFFMRPVSPATAAGMERQGEAPVMFLLLMPVLFVIIFGGVLNRGGSKEIALLGALTAINVSLRFIPLPIGGSAIFFLLILSGYTWGASFGFLLGSLTILVSSFWAGGFGPWVPFQMVATAWVGLSGAWIKPLTAKLTGTGGRRLTLAVLACFGFAWGYVFGAIMNLWFWPYLGGTAAGSAGIGNYAGFYLATSAFWDTGRAVVNFLLLLFLGGPVLKVFDRFKKRFEIEYL